jgi:hypothetical protein
MRGAPEPAQTGRAQTNRPRLIACLLIDLIEASD